MFQSNFVVPQGFPQPPGDFLECAAQVNQLGQRPLQLLEAVEKSCNLVDEPLVSGSRCPKAEDFGHFWWQWLGYPLAGND